MCICYIFKYDDGDLGWVVENFVWKPARQASTTDPSSWHLVRPILYSLPLIRVWK